MTLKWFLPLISMCIHFKCTYKSKPIIQNITLLYIPTEMSGYALHNQTFILNLFLYKEYQAKN